MSGTAAFLRSAPLALLGSVSSRVHELTSIDEVLRRPVPVSRRIGFVQLRGGVGASSTSAYVAALLARRRHGAVLGVDASRGPRGLAWHAGTPASGRTGDGRRRATARSSADATDGLPRAASGLWSLDLDGTPPGRSLSSTATWIDEVTPISRFFEFVVTDWGVRDWRTDLGEVVSASRCVCLVARADRHAAEEAAALVPAIREHPDRPDVVVALVDVGDAGRAAPDVLDVDPAVPVVHVPHDAVRGSARPVGSGAVGTRTRIAYARLAAALVGPAEATPVAPAPAPPAGGTRADRSGGRGRAPGRGRAAAAPDADDRTVLADRPAAPRARDRSDRR